MRASDLFDERPKDPTLISVSRESGFVRKYCSAGCLMTFAIQYSNIASRRAVFLNNNLKSRRSELLKDLDIDHATKRCRPPHA